MQIFPKWTNKVPLAIAAGAPLVLAIVSGAIWYYFSPWYTDVGYAPQQPVPYSHKLHAGEMGIDCLYCHGTAEVSSEAAVPPTQICMNCHRLIKTDSPVLKPIRDSFEQDKPVEWVRVHKIPDFAHFPHSPHLAAGVGCVECHGRIDQMIVVTQNQPLSMSWCLDCHRDPAPHLRPPALVTKMDWTPTDADVAAAKARVASLNPPQHCSGCHR